MATTSTRPRGSISIWVFLGILVAAFVGAGIWRREAPIPRATAQGICVDGTCADGGDAGDACASPLECKAGLSCLDTDVCGSFVTPPEQPVCE